MPASAGRARRSGCATVLTKHLSTWATTNRWLASTTTAGTTARTAVNTFTTSDVQSLSSAKAGSTSMWSPSTVGASPCTERARRSPDAVGCRPLLREGRDLRSATALVQKSTTTKAQTDVDGVDTTLAPCTGPLATRRLRQTPPPASSAPTSSAADAEVHRNAHVGPDP